MCPACMTTAALLTVGVTSAGGLTAAIKKLRAKAVAKGITNIRDPKEQHRSVERQIGR
jgi:hypothetical protein